MLRYREIKLEIQKLIADMSKGDKLPSRMVLSKKLDASRATIDKAIKELIEEGYLEGRFGSGTYVVQRLEGVVANRRNWCLLVPNMEETIYAKLINSVTKAAREDHTNLILCNSEDDIEQQREQIQRLITAGVDGFIIVPVVSQSVADNLGIYQSLKQSKIPFVFCNRGVEGISAPLLKMNDVYCGYLAACYLIDRGYRNIVFLSRQKYRTSIERCEGYICALQSYGMPVCRKNILMLPDNAYTDCYDALVERLNQEDPVDAVLCFNNKIAAYAAKAIEDAGLQISDDIGVIACGVGWQVSDQTQERRVTHVSRKDDLGMLAASVLRKMIANEVRSNDFESYLIEPEVIDLGSCKGPRVKR